MIQMKISQAELDLYFSEISQAMVFQGAEKEQHIAELRSMVADYLDENPSASREEIEEHFGTPIEIAGSFIEEMENKTLIEDKLKSKKRFRKVAIIAICLAVIAAITGYIVFEVFYVRNGEVDVIITEGPAIPLD